MLKKIHHALTVAGLGIARAITWILLPLAYWLPFAMTALCMKLFGKSLFPRFPKDRAKADTFWLPAPDTSADLEQMKRQF